MTPTSRKAVVLLSGGLDSTTAMFWARAQGYQIHGLAVDYGQRHGRELLAARRVAALAGAALHEVKLTLPWLSVSSLLNKKKRLPRMPLSKIGRGGIPSTYVPGRNTMFLALGMSMADSLGAEAIVIGANALDYSGYPDCRPEFIEAFEHVARFGSRRGAEGAPLRVLAPLQRLDKEGIVRLALKVGAPIDKTWSCYQGGAKPCGKCDSCKLRAKGFAEAGLADPAIK